MNDSTIDPSIQVAALQIAEQVQKAYTPDFQGKQTGMQALQQRARLIGDLAHEMIKGLRDGPLPDPAEVSKVKP